MVGFCALLVNAFGPVHVYDAAAETVKLMVAPAQYGPVLFTEIVGVGFTTTTTTACAVQPPTPVTFTVYVVF